MYNVHDIPIFFLTGKTSFLVTVTTNIFYIGLPIKYETLKTIFLTKSLSNSPVVICNGM